MVRKIDTSFKRISIELKNGAKIDMQNCRLDYTPNGELFLVNEDSVTITENSFLPGFRGRAFEQAKEQLNPGETNETAPTSEQPTQEGETNLEV